MFYKCRQNLILLIHLDSNALALMCSLAIVFLCHWFNIAIKHLKGKWNLSKAVEIYLACAITQKNERLLCTFFSSCFVVVSFFFFPSVVN